MERVSFDIERQDVADALREQAAAHGRTVEAELGSLVARTYAKRAEDDWVNELIAMTRPGVEDFGPDRLSWERQVPFKYDDFD